MVLRKSKKISWIEKYITPGNRSQEQKVAPHFFPENPFPQHTNGT